MERARGIDVSRYQDVTSWADVHASGMSFVGVKATEGAAVTNPRLGSQRAGARSMPFTLATFYHFCRPGDPKGQAQRFMDTVGPLRANERLCADLEDDKTGLPAVDLKWADAFYTELLGGTCSDRRPLIYTSRRVWLQLGNPAWDLASELDLWAPRYGPDEPELPVPWKPFGWKFWQYSEDEIVPGVNGKCDSSYFNGDANALRAYAALSAPAPSP